MKLRNKINISLLLLVATSIAVYGILFNQQSYRDELVLAIFLGASIAVYLFLFGPLKQSLSRLSAMVAKQSAQQLQEKGKNEIEQIAEAVTMQVKEVQQASAFINDIKSGNLKTEIAKDTLAQNGLMSTLLDLRTQMIAFAEAEKERNWVTEGMAKFVEILRNNNNNSEEFYDNIIGNVVKYLNANQGGLFIVNEREDEKYLTLASCYAYDRKKFMNKEITAGNGLVGQAFLEKETILLKEVPKNYTAITSGLGHATPTNLLIVPLKVNETVHGIIEIASFDPFKEYQITFLEKLGESIASTIYNLTINEHTKRLLTESQQTTEEMKAQEEELKQNMEELEATQEEMRRKENEMAKLLKKMEESEKLLKERLQEIRVMKEKDEERSKEMIKKQEEYKQTLIDLLNKLPQKIFLKDKDGKFLLANTALAEAHHKTVDELLGTSDFDFFSFEQATIYRNAELEVIAAGKPVYFPEEIFKDPKGPDRVLQTTKMPFYIRFLDETGLLGIQTDITEVKKAEQAMKERESSRK